MFLVELSNVLSPRHVVTHPMMAGFKFSSVVIWMVQFRRITLLCPISRFIFTSVFQWIKICIIDDRNNNKFAKHRIVCFSIQQNLLRENVPYLKGPSIQYVVHTNTHTNPRSHKYLIFSFCIKHFGSYCEIIIIINILCACSCYFKNIYIRATYLRYTHK